MVAVGDCAVDGGCFAGSYAVVGGVADVVPVDIIVRGEGEPELSRTEAHGILVHLVVGGNETTVGLILVGVKRIWPLAQHVREGGWRETQGIEVALPGVAEVFPYQLKKRMADGREEVFHGRQRCTHDDVGGRVHELADDAYFRGTVLVASSCGQKGATISTRSVPSSSTGWSPIANSWR